MPANPTWAEDKVELALAPPAEIVFRKITLPPVSPSAVIPFANAADTVVAKRLCDDPLLATGSVNCAADAFEFVGYVTTTLTHIRCADIWQ
jgi:hypothetical protein